jgi:hypothetical protein
MEQRYPNASERRAFADEILSNSRECLRRAYALQALASRYPKLDDPEIAAIARDHLIAMKQNWQLLSNLVAPALPTSPAESTAANWPTGTRSLLASMRDLDSRLTALFIGKEDAFEPLDPATTMAETRTFANAVAGQLMLLVDQL